MRTLIFVLCALFLSSLVEPQTTKLKERSSKNIVFRKGSLTGKAVVPKTTALVSLAGSTPVPSSKRISNFELWFALDSHLIQEFQIRSPKSDISSGPVAQRNQSATLRRSRSHVQIVPGPPTPDTEMGRRGDGEKVNGHRGAVPASPHPRVRVCRRSPNGRRR